MPHSQVRHPRRPLGHVGDERKVIADRLNPYAHGEHLASSDRHKVDLTNRLIRRNREVLRPTVKTGLFDGPKRITPRKIQVATKDTQPRLAVHLAYDFGELIQRPLTIS